LAITKQLTTELSSKTLDGTGLTPEDLLNQRMMDANRFAFMLAAMQEQLEFERAIFVGKIHQLENVAEHKDVQINVLYQLYNELVAQTQKKGWFEKLLE